MVKAGQARLDMDKKMDEAKAKTGMDQAFLAFSDSSADGTKRQGSGGGAGQPPNASGTCPRGTFSAADQRLIDEQPKLTLLGIHRRRSRLGLSFAGSCRTLSLACRMTLGNAAIWRTSTCL